MLSKIAEYKAHVERQNPTAPIRMGITDAEGVELIGELVDANRIAEIPNGDAAAAASSALAVVLAQTIPSDPDQLQDWAERKGAASRALWDALQGSVVDGVEIIRKRVS